MEEKRKKKKEKRRSVLSANLITTETKNKTKKKLQVTHLQPRRNLIVRDNKNSANPRGILTERTQRIKQLIAIPVAIARSCIVVIAAAKRKVERGSEIATCHINISPLHNNRQKTTSISLLHNNSPAIIGRICESGVGISSVGGISRVET